LYLLQRWEVEVYSEPFLQLELELVHSLSPFSVEHFDPVSWFASEVSFVARLAIVAPFLLQILKKVGMAEPLQR
jgi:hypothetical protein